MLSRTPASPTPSRPRGRLRAAVALLGLTASTLGLGVVTASPASAAAALTIRPVTWNVLGLDSNRPATDGPSVFPVGARICNTGDAPAAGLTTSLVFDSANANIGVLGPSTLTFPDLAAGACTDTYFNVGVNRTAAAFDTTRRYRITAAATGVGTVSTPTNRELYIERLISQNRNDVVGISGSAITSPPSAAGPGTATVYVGQTYDFTVTSSTATGGYEQLESFLDFPSGLFQILRVNATYSQPTGATNDTIYADACGWDNNIGPRPSAGTYLSCVGPEKYLGGKAGGASVVTTYTVKVLAAGSGRLSTLIYDYSGSSFHYNSDFGADATSVQFVAAESPDLALAKTHVGSFQRGGTGSYTLTTTNLGKGATTGPITLTDTLPAGLSFVSATGTGFTCSAVGQTVTCTNPGPIAPGGTRTLVLNVAVAANAPATVTNTATVITENDGNRANDTATDPTALNSPPVAVQDSATTSAGTPVTIAVLGNDTDPDADRLTITASTAPTTGTATCTATSCTYTPPAGFVGTASFTYTITDGRGGSSTTTVTVTVANSPPAYTADATNTSQTVDAGEGLAPLAATDADGDRLTYTLVGGTLPPRVALNPDGTFSGTTSTPGTYTVTVQVSDGRGGTALTTLTVVVEDPATSSLGDLVLDDTNGNGAQDAGETGLAGALVTLTRGGDVVATTTSDPAGAYLFSGLTAGTYAVTVTAPAGYVGTAPLSQTVTVPLATAVTTADFALQRQDASLAGLVFSDVDGDGVRDAGEGVLAGATVTVAGGGTTRTLTTDADGRYGLAGLPAGSYVVSVTVPAGSTATTTNPLTVVLAEGEQRTGVDFGVRPPNRTPDAVDDAVTVASGGTSVLDPRTNDVDLDGDPLVVTASTQPADGTGTVSCTATACTFTAATGFVGTTSYTYTVSDGRGGSDTATVTVTVQNAPPVFTDAPANTDQTVQVGDPLAPLAATDANGDALTYALVEGALPPGVTLSPDGRLVGATTGTGTFTATLTVRDARGGVDTTVLVVEVTEVPNTAPVPADDAASTTRDVPVTIMVLVNDADADGDALTVTASTPPGPGTGSVSCSATTCTFTPAPGFVGTTTFTYTVADGRGGSGTAEVTVTVAPPPNQAPVFTEADDQSVQVGTGTFTPVVATDDSGVAPTYSLVSGTLPAGVVLGPDGALSGTPDETGTFSIVVRATDGATPALSTDTTIVLRVLNTAPVFTPEVQDQAIVVGEGLLPLTATDANGDPLTYTVVDGTLPPQIALGPDGTFTGVATTPGTYVVTVGVTDGRGGMDVIELRLVVSDPGTARIGDLVYDDANGNGAQDAGEPGLAGVTVTLSDGATTTTTTTGTDGSYAFNGLDAGRYTVTVTAPAGRTATSPASVPVTLGVAETVTSADFALQLRTASLAGTAYVDTDRDGVRDTGETTGLGGLTVTVTGQLGTVTVLTAADGSWSVGGLAAGTYAVTVSTPEDSIATTPQPLTVEVGAGQAVTGADTGFASANTPPVAQDDAVSTGKGDVLVLDPRVNDTDAESTVLVLAVTVAPTHGTVVCDADGCTYTPDADYAGPDSFTYSVTDGGGLTDTAVVSIDVVNAAPVFSPAAQNDAQTVLLGQRPLAVVATDDDGDALVYTLQSGSLPPGVTLNRDGSFAGAATTDGTYVAVLRVTDSSGATGTTELTLQVPAAADDPPVYTDAATNDAQTVPVGGTVVALAATDPEGLALTYVLVGGELPPGVRLSTDGTFTGSPTTPGVYGLTVEARDPSGQAATTVLTVTVPNGAPVFGPEPTNDTQSVPVGGALAPLTASDPDVDPLTFRISDGFAPDGLFLNPDGTFSGSPTTPGTYAFTVTVDDGRGGTDTTVLTVVVPDAPPVFSDAATNDTQTVTIGGRPVPLAATDPDGSPVAYAVTTGALPEGLVLNSDGTFGGAATERGTTTVTVTATDRTGATGTTELTLVVVGSPPVAVEDRAATRAGDPVAILVTGNDTDADGDALRVLSSTQPASGTVVCEGTTCTYRPAAGFVGTDAFRYTVTDDREGTSTTTVTVTVLANGAPVAADDRATTGFEQPVEVVVLTNDTDPDGDPLTVSLATPPASGTATCDGTTCTYVPADGFSGTDTFTYAVSDGRGGSDTAVVTITVLADPNRAPVFTDAPTNTVQEVLPGEALSPLLATDADGGVLTYAVVLGDLPPGVVLDPDGTFTGTSTRPGDYVVTVTVTDDRGVTDTTVLTITVLAPPAFSGDASNDEQTVQVGAAPRPLTASDPDGTAVTYAVTGGSLPAGVTLQPDGSFAGAATTRGVTTATVTATDADGQTSTTDLRVTVVGSAPVAVADTATTRAGETVGIGVAANDTDADGDVLTVSSVTQPANGTVACSGGLCTYRPAAGFSGTDVFTYTVSDGREGTSTTTVTVTVVANARPDAVDDSVTTAFATPVEVRVLANDTDPEGDPLTATVTAQPANGTVTCDGTTCTYVPADGFSGTDTFGYGVSDGRGGADTAVVTVVVTAAPNEAPVFTGAAANTAQTVAVGDPVAAVVATDADDTALRYTLTGGALPPGVTALEPDGSFTGSPTQPGTYELTITVTDPSGASDTTVLVLTVPVPPVDAPPVFTDAPANTSQRVVQGEGLAPLAATDPEGGALTYTVTGGSLPPAVVLDPDGTFSGTTTVPGTYTVQVTVTDPAGGSDTTTLTVVVAEAVVDAAPRFTDAPTNTAQTVDVSGTPVPLAATDPEGGALTYTVTGGSLPPSVVLNADGTFSGTATVPGTFTVEVTVTDGAGGSDTTTLVVTVPEPDVNAAPAFTPAPSNTTQTVAVGDPLTAVVATDADDTDLTYVLTGGALPPGVTALNADGSFAGTPTTPGTYELTVTVRDPAGAGDVTTLVVTVPAPPNSAPVAVDDARTTPVDTAVEVAVLANDTDADGDALTAAVLAQPANGAVVCDGTTCTYTPSTGFTGEDSFTYTVSDGQGGSDTATVVVTVVAPEPGNTAPAFTDAATNDAQTVPLGSTPTALDAADADGDPLVFAVSAGALPPGVVLEQDGTFTGAPTEPGTYELVVTVTDTSGATATTTLVLTVPAPPADQPPVAADDAASTPFQTEVTVPVLGNDTDPDGGTLTVAAVEQPANGTVTCSATSCTYVPAPGFTGTDTFTYTVADGQGGSDTATVTVTVGAAPAVNTVPVAVDDARSTPFQTAVTVPVVANDTDADGDALTVVALTQPSNGAVTCSTTACEYVPAPGFSGTDTFTYTVADGQGGSDTATVTVTVGAAPAVNAVPVAVDDARSTPFQTAVTVPVVANDTDADGDALRVVALTQPANGRVTCDATSCTYVPAAGFAGTDAFTYTVGDGNGGSDTATVTITVGAAPAVNTAPDAVTDSADAAYQSPVTVQVLANDTDADGDALTVVALTQPSNGRVTCTATACTYTPAAGFSGTDAFTYTVSDGRGGSDTTTVVVTVAAPQNVAPVAGDDTATTGAGAPVTVPVLANDTDADGGTLTVAVLTQPANGVVSCDGTVCTYRPNAGFSGTDTFTYAVSDGQGGTDTATVTVTVAAPANQAPVFSGDTTRTVPVGGTVPPVVMTDPEGRPVTVTLTGGTLPDGVVLNPDGTFTGTPTTPGTSTVELTGTDVLGATTTVTITIVVPQTPNTRPVAVDDATGTPQGTPVVIDVIGNDTDADGDDLVITVTTPPRGGTVDCTATACVYTPDPDFTGTDTFTYTVSDGNGGTDTATVTVEVLGDAPVPPVVGGGAGGGGTGTGGTGGGGAAGGSGGAGSGSGSPLPRTGAETGQLLGTAAGLLLLGLLMLLGGRRRREVPVQVTA